MKFLTWLRSKLMARPSLIRPLSGGEIILKSVDPELVKQIKALVEGVTTNAVPVATINDQSQVQPEPTPVASEHPMPKTAIGVFKDMNEVYKFVQVKYNPTSLQARVEKVTNIGIERAEASEKFKIEAVKNNFVS